MMWIHAPEGNGFELWTNVSDVVVMWFTRELGPNTVAEVAGRALRQGTMRTFSSTDSGTIARLHEAMTHAPWVPWVPVQSQRVGWERFVNLEKVSEVRRMPASSVAPDGPQKLVLTLTSDARDNPSSSVTETIGEIFDPDTIDRVIERMTRTPRGQ